ncbi:cyclic-di-GMP phosphodiesterase, flagellum assembly factor TipF [Tistlia consotensis]|uniref:Cyclic-di-GMP phosphodiesterase, flagellum assembly factor TipF n=1 Tax=Tistlia consotensis USBA 355 TaxID=560819 RepID=A0A1Y6C245_9PROT|nr:EAL domain-containing protein [Tistlia consotensis]SMF39328.1 cyclic-di-GMP phosphodiesterase, flagellum assembly factor TipF [Tistlia consotensis USBA 355]SNR36447.1 cyclic-di-GMP phosphodiesterase, flagellum assembly factor TipF [Tistlia consotensis]
MLTNLLLLAGYAALTGLTAWYLPRFVPGLDPALALGVGVGGFLLCALAHEVSARLAREARLSTQMTRLRQSYFQVEEELSWARREMRSLLEALEQGAPRDGQATRAAYEKARAVDEVMAEIKLLKSLVAKLSARRPEPADPVIAELRADDPGARPAGAGDDDEEAPAKSLVARRKDRRKESAEERQEAEVLEIVHEALRQDRIEVVLQPIVSLPQRKRRFYEAFTRMRDDEDRIVPAQRYIGVAERAGLITAIDNMLVFRCVQLIRRIQQRPEPVDFFCNLSGHTLRDREFLADFANYLTTNGDLGRNLVFEMAQADLDGLPAETLKQFERLHRLGCRFSLDKVEDINLDPKDLAERHVAYVKLDARALVTLAEVQGSDAVQTLLGGLTQCRIDVIVEKIESEDALRELLDFGIDFGQGYLFGEPRPAKLAA